MKIYLIVINVIIVMIKDKVFIVQNAINVIKVYLMITSIVINAIFVTKVQTIIYFIVINVKFVYLDLRIIHFIVIHAICVQSVRKKIAFIAYFVKLVELKSNIFIVIIVNNAF